MDIIDLCRACSNGKHDVVEEILAKGDVDVNGVNSYGVSPLFCATVGNYPSIVKMLLDNANTKLDYINGDWPGKTSLQVACTCVVGSVEIVKMFISDSRCTDELLNMRGQGGESALMIAGREGYLDIVKILAELPGVDLFTKTGRKTVLQVVLAEKTKWSWEEEKIFKEERVFSGGN